MDPSNSRLITNSTRLRVATQTGAVLAMFLILASVIIVSIRRSGTATTNKVPDVARASMRRQPDVAAIFNSHVEPALTRLNARDQEAAQQAIAKIHAHFEHAKTGAPEFATSIISPLNSIKANYLSGKGAFLRWWYSDPSIQPVADHVRWNYEQHVTSGPKIKDAISAAVADLDRDFRANRNEAIQSIGASLRRANLPSDMVIDVKKLDVSCQREFEREVTKMAAERLTEKAAVDPSASLDPSTFAKEIAERIAEDAIISVLRQAVAVAGGTMISGTAGGASAGSWLPGPGSAIGAAAGLLAGLAVDIWINHKNRERTVNQVVTSLTQIEDAILNGEGGRQGLKPALENAASQQRQTLATEVRAQLTH